MIRYSIAMCFLLAANSASAQNLTATKSLVHDGDWEFQAAAGATTVDGSVGRIDVTSNEGVAPAGFLALRYGLTERLQLSIITPSLAYLGGTPGDLEWIPWGGLTSLGLGASSVEGFVYAGRVAAGIDIRKWTGHATALNFGGAVDSEFRGSSKNDFCDGGNCDAWQRDGLGTWAARVSVGLTQRVHRRVLVNLGVAAKQNFVFDGSLASGALDSTERHTSISLGSVQSIGTRSLPLVQAWINHSWSLDGYAAGVYSLDTEKVDQVYMLGATRTW